jgi:hypothetical protein
MIWIASYPRSGNTFLRNLFFDVFNLESTSYPKEGKHKNENKYQITKTHHLPNKIPTLKESDFVIYLVRDGRDSTISNAYYKKNFIDPNSNFNDTIEEIIIARKGSHFGGWSNNVFQWSKRADIIIRFEDLIQDPEYWLRKIADKTKLPAPDYSKIKGFKELKEGTPKYGSGAKTGNQKKFANKFFRAGKVGANKTEMKTSLRDLHWLFHGDVMQQLGYTKDGTIRKFERNAITRKTNPFKKVKTARIRLQNLSPLDVCKAIFRKKNT